MIICIRSHFQTIRWLCLWGHLEVVPGVWYVFTVILRRMMWPQPVLFHIVLWHKHSCLSMAIEMLSSSLWQFQVCFFASYFFTIPWVIQVFNIKCCRWTDIDSYDFINSHNPVLLLLQTKVYNEFQHLCHKTFLFWSVSNSFILDKLFWDFVYTSKQGASVYLEYKVTVPVVKKCFANSSYCRKFYVWHECNDDFRFVNETGFWISG